jgi:AraC-like DNA-binding protein
MNQPLIYRIISFILDNYTNPKLTKIDIIKHLKIHKNILYFKCHMAFDISVMELVEIIRLHKAINYILLGENKAWMKTGYNSNQTFPRVLKKRIGMKISVWR